MLIKNLHTCVYRIGYRSSFLFLFLLVSEWCNGDIIRRRYWNVCQTVTFITNISILCISYDFIFENHTEIAWRKKLTKKATNRNGFDNDNEVVLVVESMCGSSSDHWNPFEIVKLNSSDDFFPLFESRKKHHFWIHCPFDVWGFDFVFWYSNRKCKRCWLGFECVAPGKTHKHNNEASSNGREYFLIGKNLLFIRYFTFQS